MPIALRCAECGTEFRVPPSRAGRGARFCSSACSGRARRIPPAERFWDKVDRSGECWTWTATRGLNGYGYLVVGPGHRSGLAHRLAYEFAHGSIPAGMLVRHTCDNPPCVRPEHLRLGTPAENVGDRLARGRQHRGERTGGARLTAEQVRAIRTLAATTSQRAIARMLGVNRATVADVLHGVTWTHV